MKQILIPTDFSENSQNALRYAVEYFKGIPVNFYLLHVSPQSNPPIAEELLESPENPQSGISQNLLHKLKETAKNCQILTPNPLHKFHCILEKVSLVEAIRKQVTEKEIDCILMGTKGASNIENREIGSNTAEVITKVKCPVLVIPERAKFRGMKNIAFPTDYNCIYKNKVVNTLSDTLKLHHSNLRIVNTKPREQNLNSYQADSKRFLQDFLRDTKHSFHFLENKNIEIGVQNFVETCEIDMIALIAKNLNIVQRLLFRPGVNSVRYHCEIPFLVIHE